MATLRAVANRPGTSLRAGIQTEVDVMVGPSVGSSNLMDPGSAAVQAAILFAVATFLLFVVL